MSGSRALACPARSLSIRPRISCWSLTRAADVVRRYGAAGGAVSSFDGSTTPDGEVFTALKDIAVQDDGDVLVVDGERVVRFADDDSYQATFADLPATPAVITAVPGGDDSIVGHVDPVGYNPSTFEPVTADLYRYVGDGYNGSFKFAGNRIIPVGLAVADNASGKLYGVADGLFGGLFGDVGVEVFDPYLVELPATTDVAANPTSYGARLTGKVIANNDPTRWTFEYGETTGYGHQFPAAPGGPAIPAGTDPVKVSRVIGGLEPNTTYHYRLAATNGAGTTGADHTFTTKAVTPAGPPGDTGRVYEQVSPVDKNGQSVDYKWTVQSRDDGNAIAYSSAGAFAGAETSVTDGLLHRPSQQPGLVDGRDRRAAEQPRHYRDDAEPVPRRRSLVDDPGWHHGSHAGRDGGSRQHLPSRQPHRPANPAGHRRQLRRSRLSESELWPHDYLPRKVNGAASDLSAFAFTSRAQLLPDAIPGIPNAYQYLDGQLQIAGRLPDGSVPPYGTAVGSLYPATPDPVMSADGRRMLFLALGSDGFGPLYMRVNGTTTKLISGSRVTGGDPTAPVQGDPAGASDDLSVVWFMSPHVLTDDTPGPGAGTGYLYRYDVEADTLTNESGEFFLVDVHMRCRRTAARPTSPRPRRFACRQGWCHRRDRRR